MGTFVGNMNLPIHRWFRYSAGFAAEWVNQVLDEWEIDFTRTVLDPFAGSGTVPIVCDERHTKSIGIEAHPVVARVSRAKLSWATSVDDFTSHSQEVWDRAESDRGRCPEYPSLIERSFDTGTLHLLHRLRAAWVRLSDQSPASELVWLVITSILRPCSKAGTAQWQYILPNKSKRNVLSPEAAYHQQVAVMAEDMRWMQTRAQSSYAESILGDARSASHLTTEKIDAVITSPPYANNYDYADALRFEMTFWGDVTNWAEIHDRVRRYLLVSSSQHSSKEKLREEDLLDSPEVEPIRSELSSIVAQLRMIRETKGGKKHYHTMIAAYCRDIGSVMREMRILCKEGARMCWIIGDSAPYGIYCPIDRWIGDLALAAGFHSYRFEKLRDRNIKWKNRKHNVPLKEGLLWIEG